MDQDSTFDQTQLDGDLQNCYDQFEAIKREAQELPRGLTDTQLPWYSDSTQCSIAVTLHRLYPTLQVVSDMK